MDFILFHYMGLTHHTNKRCTNRHDALNYTDTLYDKHGHWLLSPLSWGIIWLAVITIVITMIAIALVVLCWLSNMRQSLLTPSYSELDAFETQSSHGKCDITLFVVCLT